MSDLGRGMVSSRRARLLIAGDIAVLVGFAVLGRRTHDEATGWAALGSVLETALPFLVGWIVAAWLLSATAEAATSSPRSIVARMGAVWLAALPVAIILRGLLLGRFSPWTFYVVAVTVPLLMLLGWRLLFVVGERRLNQRRPAPR